MGKTLAREQKAFAFQIKETDDAQGIVRGYLSTFDNVDDGGDRVRNGAFRRTLANKYQYKQQHGTAYLFPLLWQHDTTQPIGGYTEAKEDNIGLFVEIQLDLDVQRGREAYSALKKGYVFQQSIGYEPLQTEYVKVDGQMVRDLTEIRLWEGSIVTIPMNSEAVVTGVKSADGLEEKAVCGNTSGTIGPRDESWDGSAAEKWIWSKALGEDDKVKSAVAKKYFMRVDGDASRKGSYSYPFWIDDHISVGAVKAIAGALSGARNADAEGDSAGLKSKVETLYTRINKKYPDDPQLAPPWKGDDGKAGRKPMERKTFLEHYNEEKCEDLLDALRTVWFAAFCKSVVEAFKIGDAPASDIADALDAFKEQFLADFVEQAVACDLSDYLATDDRDSPLNSYGLYGYMSRRERLARKAMLESDGTTGGLTDDHVGKLHKAVEKATKAFSTHVEALHNAANEVTTLIGGTDRNQPDHEKRRALLLARKAGRTFSAENTQALSDHADSLHELADSHEKAMKRQFKAVQTVADDLADVLQGAEAAYGTDPGTPNEGRAEGKTHRASSPAMTRTPQSRSSQVDTVNEDDITAALAGLKALKTV